MGMVKQKSGPRTAVIVRLAPDLLARIDQAARDRQQSRNETVTQLLDNVLGVDAGPEHPMQEEHCPLGHPYCAGCHLACPHCAENSA